MKVIFFMLALLTLSSVAYSQSQQCQKFVTQLIQNIVNFDAKSIPLPSIKYSGITTNNPGMFYQCQHQPNFSYYLLTIKNTTTNTNYFTGVCVPSQCSKQDLKIALDFWDCEVYDFPQEQSDVLAIFGIVILSIWLSILIVWSIVISCRQQQVKEHIKKQKQQETSVNSLVDNRSSNNTNENDEQGKGQFVKSHIFNYYEGYCRIFKKQKRKSLFGSFLFLSVLSFLISTDFSFKQTISSNPGKTYDFFNSFLGIFVTNTELAFSMIMFVLGMKLGYGVYKFVSFHQIGRYFFDQLLKKWLFLVIISISIYGVMSFTSAPLSKYWSLNYTQDCPKCMWEEWFLFRNLQLDNRICLPWLWILEAQILLTLLSAPFIIIFRIKKNMGYILMGLACLASMLIGFAILSDQGVSFQPTKIFNQQKQYSINYQANTLVRAGAFYLGLMFAFLVIQGLEKVQGKRKTAEYRLAKRIRKSKLMQTTLHVLGVAIMVTVFSLVSLYFDRENRDYNKTSAYYFLSLSPMAFLVGFGMFVLPSLWQVETGLAYYINKIFASSIWDSLQKLSLCLLAVGPAVMGFATYSTQNNIYFDLQTITVYLLGDLLMVYVIGIFICAAIQNQIFFISNWTQNKIFGKENNYSILLLEE